jgi:hypothetical protein
MHHLFLSVPIQMQACLMLLVIMIKQPDEMAAEIEEYLKEGLVNIVGGCCGSTPGSYRKNC